MRDALGAISSRTREIMLVKNWMSKNVITVDINGFLIDAIKLLKHNDIGRLSVMKKGEMVGIVTDRDVKRVSASDAVSLEIHELLYLLSKLKIEEILSSYQNSPEGYRNVYIKAYQIDREKISELKNELRGKATMLYFVDQRENKREVYAL